MDERFDRDEDLLAELREAGRLDPVPQQAVAAARAAFIWRTIDDELAELTYDSVFDDRLLAGVRSTASARFLTFQAPDLTIELEASAAGDRRHLTGQLGPPQPAEIVVWHRGGAVTIHADELGRFLAEDLPPGPIRLRCRASSGATIATDWVLV